MVTVSALFGANNGSSLVRLQSQKAIVFRDLIRGPRSPLYTVVVNQQVWVIETKQFCIAAGSMRSCLALSPRLLLNGHNHYKAALTTQFLKTSPMFEVTAASFYITIQIKRFDCLGNAFKMSKHVCYHIISVANVKNIDSST